MIPIFCINHLSFISSIYLLFSFISIGLDQKRNETGLEAQPNTLILEENFENNSYWEGDSYAYQQFAEEHAFEVVDKPVFSGAKSGKFELRYGDRMATKNGGPRAEVLFSKQSHHERWYSFAVFFPSYGWEDDMDDELVTQWHSGLGTPTLSLRINNGNLKLRIGHSLNIPTSRWNFYEFGAVPKDEWNEFVFHVVHSQEQDGLVEVWKNGEKIVTHYGPNLYPDSDLPRWKVGIYKSSWRKRKTNVNLRIIYFDDIKIANEKTVLEQMLSLESK
jgi:hypothetical protein